MGSGKTILTTLGATVAVLVFLNVLFALLRGPDVTKAADMLRHRDWYHINRCEDISQSCPHWCVVISHVG